MARQQEQKTVLILGGGTGGLVTARELRKKLDSDHRIVIVDREEQHLFQPSLLWLMIGERESRKISRDLARLERKGIEVIHGEINLIDPETKTIKVADQTITTDYLVVSLGANLVPEKIPGLKEAGHNLYALDGSEEIREQRLGLTSG